MTALIDYFVAGTMALCVAGGISQNYSSKQNLQNIITSHTAEEIFSDSEINYKYNYQIRGIETSSILCLGGVLGGIGWYRLRTKKDKN